ncbi:gamma-glutamylcyclotransferase family protein [Sphingomonas sp. MMS24-J13]|uniref:gamma-glutamylcyclotransferase family protein n=1 Tax=Sphingomonas sp. MMS24-J13 TaxID=3238686 RepID=UPI00385031F4
MTDDRIVWLFSYGTLRQREVQTALFGRLLDEEPDSLPGFRIDTIEIAEPDIVNLSGKATHLILRRVGESERDSVIGAALRLRESELAAADDYEGDNYQRIEVALGSGRRAFVYVAPERA